MQSQAACWRGDKIEAEFFGLTRQADEFVFAQAQRVRYEDSGD
jgi:hypothetical protein